MGRCRGGGMPRCARISYAEIARYNLLPPSQREVARRQPRRRECPTPRSRGERFLRKAFSPGRRCHAFWRDGCGVHRCTGQSGNLYRVPSTPGPFGATLCKQERALTRNRPRTFELRLLLEGKLAQRQLRRMRSKLPIITISWYNTATFDLIRHGP